MTRNRRLDRRATTRYAVRWAPIPIAAVILAGCSDSEPEATGDAQESSQAQTGSDDAPATSQVAQDEVIVLADGVEIPEGAPGEALSWLLGALNAQGAPDADEVHERFAQSFLNEVPAEELAAGLEQIRANAPMQVTSIQPSPGTLSASVEGVDALAIDLALNDDGLISGLTFSPDPLADRPAPGGYDQVEEELSGLSKQHNILAARVQNGQCVPVFEHQSEQAAPSGSAFKLYVLGAVVDAVERGELSWDHKLSVTEEIKSLPGGTLQEAPAGTEVSVQQAAELMISISDNTATDMLIDAVGVQAVEDVYTDMGLSDSTMDGLTPLLATAQLFQLGWGVDDDIRQEWSRADTKAQRQIVADLPEGVADIDPLSVTEPRWDEGVDYFISSTDLCAAHVALQEQAQTPAGEPVGAILAENAGIPSLAAGFDYLAFKGGSAPGQLTLTWYGEVDDVAVVAIVQVASDEQIDANQVLGPAADVLTLLRSDAAAD